MIERGPVDVIVMAAGEPRVDGSVLRELDRQVAGGTIRVLDAMILMKGDVGQRTSVDLEDLPEDLKGSLGYIETGTRGLFDSSDADTLWEGMVPGSAVLALAIENTWAIKLVNALHDAGVETALSFRVPAPIIDEALASLEQKSIGG